MPKDRVDMYGNVTIVRIEKTKNSICVVISKSGVEQSVQGIHLLVAAGRQPNVDRLSLKKGEIIYSPKGIKFDAHLRTSNKKNCPW